MAGPEDGTYTDEEGTDVVFDETVDRRLAEVVAPCFTLILQLRATDEYGDPDVLRRRIQELFDDSEREALRTGVSPESFQDAKFALVAFIDETILSSDWSEKEEWVSTPMQLVLYDRYDAGEEFFERLEKLREDPQANAGPLEVYYLCMSLGFKGKYQLHEQERLREIIEETYEELTDLPGRGRKVLSPHGEPRGRVAEEVTSLVPTWVIAAAAALVAVLLYAGAYLYVSDSASDAVETIDSIEVTNQVNS